MKSQSIVIILWFIMIFAACRRSFDPITVFMPTEEFNFVDTTLIHFPGDLDIVLDSMSTYYTLDEEIVARTYAINRSQENYDIYFLSYPPYDFTLIYDQAGQIIFALGGGGLAEGTITLLPGDSLSGGIIWPQIKNDTNQIFRQLKTYSGWYKIVNYFTGSTAFGHLSHAPIIKWIKITETGDPLTFHCNRDWNTPDTLKADFAIRNRICKNLKFKYQDVNPVAVTLFKDTDTIFVKNYDLNTEFLTLAAHSDSLLFSFKIAADDTLLDDLGGYYTLRTQIRLKERTLESDCFFSF